MTMLKKILLFMIIGFFALLPSLEESRAQNQDIAAPTILKAGVSEPANPGKLMILGVTPAGTEVLIYLNGNYIGLANTNASEGITDDYNFSYPNYLSEGTYSVMAIARDKISLVMSAPSVEASFKILPLPAPTLIEPNEKQAIGKVKPLIKGLTLSNSYIKVFIDGQYNGKTEILQHESGTANFAYKPFLNLTIGWHQAYVIAEDLSGRKSPASEVLNFLVEAPMPAPTLFEPVVNNKTTKDKPFIVGLAKNDSLIKIYIDQELTGQFQVKNHQSGTANFAFLPPKALTAGKHLVYATATDSRGKESAWSNFKHIDLSAVAEQAPTSDQAVKTDPVAKQEAEDDKTAPPIETDRLTVEKQTSGEASESSSETAKPKAKSKINLIIFIVFLVGVIGWIFWVNRELIKEKQAKQPNNDQAGKK